MLFQTKILHESPLKYPSPQFTHKTVYTIAEITFLVKLAANQFGSSVVAGHPDSGLKILRIDQSDIFHEPKTNSSTSPQKKMRQIRWLIHEPKTNSNRRKKCRRSDGVAYQIVRTCVSSRNIQCELQAVSLLCLSFTSQRPKQTNKADTQTHWIGDSQLQPTANVRPRSHSGFNATSSFFSLDPNCNGFSPFTTHPRAKNERPARMAVPHACAYHVLYIRVAYRHWS